MNACGVLCIDAAERLQASWISACTCDGLRGKLWLPLSASGAVVMLQASPSYVPCRMGLSLIFKPALQLCYGHLRRGFYCYYYENVINIIFIFLTHNPLIAGPDRMPLDSHCAVAQSGGQTYSCVWRSFTAE